MFQVMPTELCEIAEADARFVGFYFESVVAPNLLSSVRWCFAHDSFDHACMEDELLHISWMADLKSRAYKFVR